MQVAIRITEDDGPATAMQFVAPSVLLVGRHSDCDLRLEGDLVSRKHARIMLGASAFIVEDLSANGTEVTPNVTPNVTLHGERRELDYGSQVRIGPFVLTVGDVVAPVLSRPPPPPLPRRSVPPLPIPGATLLPRPPPLVGLGAVATPLGVPSLTIASPMPSRGPEPIPTDDAPEQTAARLFAPLRALLEDPSVDQVLVDGPGSVSVERHGELEPTNQRFVSLKALLTIVRAVAFAAGKPFDELSPLLEARLPDGTRIVAVLPPAARGGPYVTLRRASRGKLSVAQLAQSGALTAGAFRLLSALVATGHGVVVVGGVGSGKTSLLETLCTFIPDRERVVLLEEQAEVELTRERLVRLEAAPGATLRQLFKASLAMRGDRLVLGELQGPATLDVVLASTRGRGALMSTAVASSAREALSRIETMAMLDETCPSLPARRSAIASAVQVLVTVARLRDGSRSVTHITELVRFDFERSGYELRELYVRAPSRASGPESVAATSSLLPTGHLPANLEELAAEGYDLPQEMHEAAAHLSAAGPDLPHP